MALSILDGTQTATTLSTILSSGQHITAHTVVSLGTQAITDMRGAVSGSVVSISNFPSSQTISGTVTANPTGTQTIAGTVTANIFGRGVIGSGDFPIPIIGYDEDITTADFQITVPVQISSLNGSVGSSNPLPISGAVTAGGRWFDGANYQPVPFLVTEDGALETVSVLIQPLPTGTNRIGVVTIGGGSVTIGAGTAQIGSVTASISGTVPVSGTFWQATQPASLASLPALAAGTAQIGSVTASISNSVVTFYPMQGTTVSNTNFTSLTSSTSLVSAVAGRECLTVFNEGAGNLHISPGATCTTISYQVRLSAGDYWECPAGQLSLAHTAVFATAGTAKVTQLS